MAKGVYDRRPKRNALGLTPKQHECARLYAQGKAIKEIAREIGSHTGTVKARLAHVLRIMEVSRRGELVDAVLREAGLPTIAEIMDRRGGAFE